MSTRVRSCPDVDLWQARILELSRENHETHCWEWPKLNRDGYGMVRVVTEGRGRTTGAHRMSWLAFHGDIPGDLVIDHLCRNRGCVNPEHLELVTSLVNTRRGIHDASKRAPRGQGRKFGGTKIRMFRISDELWEASIQASAARGEDVSTVVRAALTRYVKRGAKS